MRRPSSWPVAKANARACREGSLGLGDDRGEVAPVRKQGCGWELESAGRLRIQTLGTGASHRRYCGPKDHMRECLGPAVATVEPRGLYAASVEKSKMAGYPAAESFLTSHEGCCSRCMCAAYSGGGGSSV